MYLVGCSVSLAFHLCGPSQQNIGCLKAEDIISISLREDIMEIPVQTAQLGSLYRKGEHEKHKRHRAHVLKHSFG